MGDGDIDVLSASSNDNKIAWYENNGSQNFSARTISTNASGAFSVFATDLDQDGDIDVLSASTSDDKVAWYENRGGQFALPTTNAASASLIEGEQEDVLKLKCTTGDGQATLMRS